MLWVDVKYIGMLSTRLRNFKRKGPYLFNFSCPFCGDSDTNKHKARGYIYKKGEKLNYMCHKCGNGMSVKKFVRNLDPHMADEMTLDYFGPKKKAEVFTDANKFKPERPVFDNTIDPLKGLIPLTKLPRNHYCRKYAEDRLIPEHLFDELYFTDRFYHWAHYVLPGRYKVPKVDEPRLVIPLRNRKGKLTGFQGRQLRGEDNGMKYVFVALTKEEPLIWGLDKVDLRYPIYAFEGPIDAMFIPNSIACGGGEISSDLLALDIPIEKFVVVYDNEPRSVFTVEKIQKSINRGFAVCIWPNIDEKDVNDMVKKNISRGLSNACEYIWKKIKEGTYRGIEATMALSAWSRTAPKNKSNGLFL
jgi:hypothetical protein